VSATSGSSADGFAALTLGWLGKDAIRPYRLDRDALANVSSRPSADTPLVAPTLTVSTKPHDASVYLRQTMDLLTERERCTALHVQSRRSIWYPYLPVW